MKALLTNPPFFGEGWHGIRAGCRWAFISQGNFEKEKLEQQRDNYYQTYPFFLGYAGAVLQEAGHEVWLYDAVAMCDSYAEFYYKVEKYGADIVVLETSTPSYEQDLQILANIKDMEMETALAGPMVMPLVEEIKQKKHVDYILKGEYILSLLEVCKTRRKGVYEPEFIKEMDRLPMPIRDSETIYFYNDYFSFGEYIVKPQLQMWTSMGCAYNCTFCLWRHTMTMGRVRQRSTGSVKAELKYCIEKWKFKSVLFDDDTFNMGDKHVMDISTMMRDNFADIEWYAMVRLDSCSIKAFQTMKDCGCWGLKIGIETFQPKALERIEKGMKEENMIEKLMKIIDMGFYVYLSTMQYIPGETKIERIKKEKLLKELRKLGVRWQRPYCVPLPGTKLFEQFEQKGFKMRENWFDYGRYEESNITDKIKYFNLIKDK